MRLLVKLYFERVVFAHGPGTGHRRSGVYGRKPPLKVGSVSRASQSSRFSSSGSKKRSSARVAVIARTDVPAGARRAPNDWNKLIRCMYSRAPLGASGRSVAKSPIGSRGPASSDLTSRLVMDLEPGITARREFDGRIIQAGPAGCVPFSASTTATLIRGSQLRRWQIRR